MRTITEVEQDLEKYNRALGFCTTQEAAGRIWYKLQRLKGELSGALANNSIFRRFGVVVKNHKTGEQFEAEAFATHEEHAAELVAQQTGEDPAVCSFKVFELDTTVCAGLAQRELHDEIDEQPAQAVA